MKLWRINVHRCIFDVTPYNRPWPSFQVFFGSLHLRTYPSVWGILLIHSFILWHSFQVTNQPCYVVHYSSYYLSSSLSFSSTLHLHLLHLISVIILFFPPLKQDPLSCCWGPWLWPIGDYRSHNSLLTSYFWISTQCF